MVSGIPDPVAERATWSSQCQFILSALAYTVGFGNVWRFPYLVHDNGGAAFLVPYVLLLFLAGIPLCFLDLYLGQSARLGPNMIFAKLVPASTGLGWAMVVVSAMVSIYYNVVVSWALYYTFSSVSFELPWLTCRHDFNSDACISYADRTACREKEEFYLKDACHTIEYMCSLAKKVAVQNRTLCADTDGQNIVHPDNVIARIYASEEFYKNRMLKAQGRTWNDFGSLQWELGWILALAWFLVFLCLAEGIRSSGKAVYVTTVFRYIPLIALIILGLTLKGYQKGIKFYLLEGDWQKLKSPTVWTKAASQVFYTLGTSFGGLITQGSYNTFNHNCMRDAILISVMDITTSLFFGIAIFSMLGFMASELDVAVTEVVSSGPGLAFIVIPEALTRVPYPRIWSFIFFVMLLVLGLDTQFGMVETICTAVVDYWPCTGKHRKKVTFLICGFCFLFGLMMVREGGVLLITVFDEYAAGINVMVLAIVEIIVLQYIFGFKKIMNTLQTEMEIWIPAPLRLYWFATWCIITPVTLLIILGASFYDIQPMAWEGYIFPWWVQALGWVLCIIPICIIIISAIYVCIRQTQQRTV